MKKIKVAVVAGGDSQEYAVSINSQKGIISFLDTEKFEATPILLNREKWVALTDEGERVIDKNDFSYRTIEGERKTFDFAYITIHGTPGENGLLSSYFELIGMPYSTCKPFVSAFTFNKYFCNRFFAQLGYNVAKALLVREEDVANLSPDNIVEQLGLPLFVKPNDGGSSIATTKIKDKKELASAIEAALEEGSEALVESLLVGMEVTCGCYEDASGVHVLPVTEVVSKNEFFDYSAKYQGAVEEITPARIDKASFEKIQLLTKQIYKTVGAKGIIRVDYFLNDEGTVYLVEINTTPGMTQTSFIPQQVVADGKTMKEVLTNTILYLIDK